MHFPIIALENVETLKKDWCDDLPFDDKTLQEHTDYYGDVYNSEERRDVVNSDWFAELLDGYATLDKKRYTITFHDVDTCRRHFEEYLEDLTKELYEKAKNHTLNGYHLYVAANEYKGCSALFYLSDDGYAQTSFDFLDDATYRAGKTYKIGNIFDAHM